MHAWAWSVDPQNRREARWVIAQLARQPSSSKREVGTEEPPETSRSVSPEHTAMNKEKGASWHLRLPSGLHMCVVTHKCTCIHTHCPHKIKRIKNPFWEHTSQCLSIKHSLRGAKTQSQGFALSCNELWPSPIFVCFETMPHIASRLELLL